MIHNMPSFIHTEMLRFQRQVMPTSLGKRAHWVLDQLASSTARLSGGAPREVATRRILQLLDQMQTGTEASHLQDLLRLVDYRGADVRLDMSWVAESRQDIPYPAFCWRWKTTMAHKWATTQHINILEFIAVLNYVRKKSCSTSAHGVRFLHVLDSRVAAGVLARGRSSSKRLNRPCRRLTAYILGMDTYLLPLWTISAWMPADAASRVFVIGNDEE